MANTTRTQPGHNSTVAKKSAIENVAKKEAIHNAAQTLFKEPTQNSSDAVKQAVTMPAMPIEQAKEPAIDSAAPDTPTYSTATTPQINSRENHTAHEPIYGVGDLTRVDVTIGRISDFTNSELNDLISRINTMKSDRLTIERSNQIKAAQEVIKAALEKSGFDDSFIAGMLKEGKPISSNGRSKAPTRFVNPDNPVQTWSGRGMRPTWLVNALRDTGKPLSDFAIKE